MRSPLALCVFVVATACPAPKPTGKGTPPERFCPGAAGCEQGNGTSLEVGIAAVAVSPRGWEQPRPDFLERAGDCPEGSPLGTDGRPRCGALIADAFKDCGRDTLCTTSAGYAGPDADGTEGDGTIDWFFDCGRDRLCPGAAGYAGPDADGSEGDGQFQGFWLAGFGNNIPMYDVHDDVFARAVVLVNGDVSIALVSVDAVGLFNDDVQRMRARVQRKLEGLTPDFVLVSATHTHEGPDTMGQWGPRPVFVPQRGVDDVWSDQVLIEGVAQAVNDAVLSRKAAKVSSAEGHLGARTREVLRDSRDPQVMDDTVTVLRFDEAATGLPIGTLVHWGNHPEVLSDVNNRASSDFAWAIREAMEKGVYNAQGQLLAMGAGGTCVYLQGTVGGLMTPLGVTPTSVDGTQPAQRTYEKTKAVGDLVAQTALEALQGARPIEPPLLAYGSTTLTLKLENEAFQLVFINFDILKRRLYDFDRSKVISETNFPTLRSELSKVQLGHVRFLGVPGELFPELAIGYDEAFAYGRPQVNAMNPNPPDLSRRPGPPYLEESLGGEVNMVVGLANDELGYLVPPYDYVVHPTQPFFEQADGDHYEETNSIGPSTVPTMLEAAGRLLSWEPGL